MESTAAGERPECAWGRSLARGPVGPCWTDVFCLVALAWLVLGMGFTP